MVLCGWGYVLTDFEKWCDNRAAEVCERWFPAEKQSPATVLFDLVKAALREAAEKAPREWKNKADALERVLEEKLAERYTPRVLDEAELEKAAGEYVEAWVKEQKYGFANNLTLVKRHDFLAGARYAARRNLMARIEDEKDKVSESYVDWLDACLHDNDRAPGPLSCRDFIFAELEHRLGGG